MYESLSQKLTKIMQEEKNAHTYRQVACNEESVQRRTPNAHDEATVWRPAFVRDIDKIMNCPYYNRYADKTQVFSFYRNDDITRRGLHVQLVSRIARTIGGALNLNLDLIEAIALGHDIGHTPFGHAGEKILDDILYANAGIHFSHNVHSVRVLDCIFPLNVSLQTLSGIAAHDGELELECYRPIPLDGFEEFDRQMERCRKDKAEVKKLVPSTLEGCVVRISDIIAYIGKDRQDAERAKVIKESDFANSAIGSFNAEMVNNLMVNIIENSYGNDYVKLDKPHFEALKAAKRENYSLVYENGAMQKLIDGTVAPMTEQIYAKLKKDFKEGNKNSPIFTHHIEFIERQHYKRAKPYTEELPDEIVADYIASMTDDYFIDLFDYLFPKNKFKIEYRGYFK